MRLVLRTLFVLVVVLCLNFKPLFPWFPIDFLWFSLCSIGSPLVLIVLYWVSSGSHCSPLGLLWFSLFFIGCLWFSSHGSTGVLPSMISRRTGHLLLVNSIQGRLAVPFRTTCERHTPRALSEWKLMYHTNRI